MEQTANNKLMVSVFQEFKHNLGERNLLEILQEIKSDKYQSEINSIRYALHKGDEKTAEEIKNGLLGFTTSGTFGKSRTKANIVTYSQVVCLDFDDIPLTEINNLVTLVNGCRYTFASFISPSNEGLKVFIKVNSNAAQHTTVYNQIANFYKELSGYDFDAKCKDITRLCFVSCDTDLFLNENAVIFEVKEEVKPLKTEPIREVKHDLTTDELLDKCLKFTEQKEQYYNGNRNNFIFLFSCNANKFGIYEEDALNYCINNFDLEEREIRATVSSTYRNQSADFAKFADFANNTKLVKTNVSSQQKKQRVDDEDYMLKSPKIPAYIYDILPPILKEGAVVFKTDREKDVFLTGALSILSGCLPNVTGLYGGRIVFPNLFSFILAPAASGKGALQSAKELADKYHNEVLQNSLEEQKEYKRKLAEYRKTIREAKKGETINENEPEEPPFKVVFIPANASNSSIIKHLQFNEGNGIICETEADTMGQAFKNDWGSYSDLLRKGFHHEKISISRKTNNEYFEINEPKLSVALSGTPNQIYNIISSAEDGLFSRFIFYVFKTDVTWIDPSPYGNNVNYTTHFQALSQKVYDMVNFFHYNDTEIHLTQEQWQKFNPVFEEYLIQINSFVSSDAQSIVKRLGLVLYRICMIFTALRKFQTKITDKEIQCLDEDFEIAMALIKVYLNHNILMFENLPKQDDDDDKVFKSSSNKKLFFDALPQNFTRAEAVKIGDTFNIKERTVGNILKNCIGKYLIQPDYGQYQKI